MSMMMKLDKDNELKQATEEGIKRWNESKRRENQRSHSQFLWEADETGKFSAKLIKEKKGGK